MQEISFNCPVCAHDAFKKHLDITDHFLSQEPFAIYGCRSCGVFKTEPAPPPSEIGRYYETDAYLSHGDDQKGLFARLYRLAKSYNLGWKGRLIKSYLKGGSLLDFGCGTGDLMAHCQELGFNVRGAEPSDSAKEHLPATIRDKVLRPEEELASDRRYDIISMFHVLEHVYDPAETISSLKGKLNDGGYLIIALPNNASADAKHYGAHWAAWDVPRHLWHFRPEQIKLLMKGFGFQHVDSHPMWLDAFYVSMLSERYIGGGAISGIFQAMRSNFLALGNKKERCSSEVYVFKLSEAK